MEKKMDEKMLEDIIRKVVATAPELLSDENLTVKKTEEPADDELIDITEVNLREELLVENPNNREAYMKFKQCTPARLGIGKAGTRYKTSTMLRIRADLAAARDAVQTMVSDECVKKLNMPVVCTKASNKANYLLRPDLGRIFDEENTKIIMDNLKKDVDVQIVIGDGLSSTAIEANIDEILPAIKQGLDAYGLDAGTPIFVEYSRVGAGDYIAEKVGAKVVLILIGERPGVASSESMSCYITYAPRIGIMESCRTVISNIHRHGTPAAEAGAHIAELVKVILDRKMSGVELTQSLGD